MLVTHDMLKKSTPVCIAFNHMPWHYLAVARLDIGGQRKHFIWLTNFKKRFEWDGSFNAQAGEMLRITLSMLHDAGYLGLPESWKPGDEDDGQPPAWFELKQEAEQHEKSRNIDETKASDFIHKAKEPVTIRMTKAELVDSKHMQL